MLETMILAQLAAGLTARSCVSLVSLDLEGTVIESAELRPEGPFDAFSQASGAPQRSSSIEKLPAHCRVKMVLAPSNDSHINVELWLPSEAWNGKLLAVGNGGWAGSIQGYADMQAGLRRGYATVATDTGHSATDGPNGMFALGHPEKIVDFAYRAVHDMTVKAKRVVRAYYRDPLEHAYFKGCSTGGRQAVMSAQRYPGDFDGIIAGALANRHIHMHTVGTNRRIELARHPERAVSEEKAALVNSAVMRQCDTLGEGFLNNPRQCDFDFTSLACTGPQASGACLNPDELGTVVKFYGGERYANGELIFSGQAIGNPIPAMLPAEGGPAESRAFDTVRILGFRDPDYEWRGFDLERDMPKIDSVVGWVDAVDPDLRAFKAHGGKLLLYAGWRDTGITPENTIHYYESVLDEMGAEQDNWMRMFLAPGMGHCRGGPGPNSFDTLGALEAWREDGRAPEQMLGSNSESGLERPICAYPSFAEYKGSGDLDNAENWHCTTSD